jgi:CubicO group peptidase (beta-lactamase class C family)
MIHTFSSTSNEEVHEQVASAYNLRNGEWQSNTYIDLTLGRRIFSTSRDLYRWGRAVSTGGLWSENSIELMTTNHLSAMNPELSYGYGLVVHDGGNYGMGNLEIEQKYFIHGGNTEGYKAMLVVEENGEFILTMLSNVGDRTNEIGLTKKILNTVLNN